MTAHSAEQTTETIIHPLAPVYDKNSRILILGTMPSPSSRRQGFYYGHPQNRFWKVVAAVLRQPIPQTISEKTALILNNHLALWDVLASCNISGAQDASIKNAVPNDFSVILQNSRIDTVIAAGQKAFQLYTKLCLPQTGIPAICLPSTSPANRGRWPLEKLVCEYTILAKYANQQYNNADVRN